MQCPIDRAPHTMAFDNSVIDILRGSPSDSQGSAGTQPTNLLTVRRERYPDATKAPGESVIINIYIYIYIYI